MINFPSTINRKCLKNKKLFKGLAVHKRWLQATLDSLLILYKRSIKTEGKIINFLFRKLIQNSFILQYVIRYLSLISTHTLTRRAFLMITIWNKQKRPEGNQLCYASVSGYMDVIFSVAEFMTKMRLLLPCVLAGIKKKPLRFVE